MSIESWKKEFMPSTAKECVQQNPKDPAALVRHAMRKWEGTRTEHLARHGCTRPDDYLHKATRPSTFDATDCALCIAYHVPASEREEAGKTGCESCPLFLSLGRACDANPDDDEDEDGAHSPFSYALHGDPQPMLDALSAALTMLEEEEEQ